METAVSERQRVREVHKYCSRFQDAQIQANLQTVASTKVASPNTNLTALMQLIAWRLGMQRAMVSVVDENEQYFLAESTKTLNLEDPDRHETGDALWMGCGSTLRSEALCANTIEVPRVPNKYACFSVTDLSRDPRFCHLPYVVGGPKFRFYAGTPLVTLLGAPIGSVFVIDDRPRGPPTAAEIDFLGIMARNVMEYLEMKRGSELLQRNDVMSRGLAALVEGESSIPPEQSDYVPSTAETNKEKDLSETPKKKINLANKNITGIMKTLKNEDSSGGEEQPSRIRLPLNITDNDMTHDRIFARASNLLRESLDADYAVFYDTNVALPVTMEPAKGHTAAPPQDDTAKVCILQDPASICTPIEAVQPTLSKSISSEIGQSTSETLHDESYATQELVQVLSFATRNVSSLNNDKPSESPGFQAPDLKRLGRLLRKYPAGKLWSFTLDGDESSYEDNRESFRSTAILVDLASRKKEAKTILEYFPRARQVLFAPLWEAGSTNEMAACFVVSLRESPVFRSDKEPAFVHAFLNSVSVECSRVTIAAANRQKGDFISSISHELRSPLHGIIASTELLAESRLDGRQKEFCDTIETCGRVLLKTILDVLDYTKINNVSRERRRAEKNNSKNASRLRNTPRELENSVEDTPESAPEEFASSITDLAKLCEDSVNVVAAAHLHHTSRPDLSLHRIQPLLNGVNQKGILPHRIAPINMILNIVPGNWNFVCLPGAIQRIIMNLAGNSLKYTQSGLVQVDLFMEEINQKARSQEWLHTDQRTIVLQVADTGKGITSEFLKNKLFTPFSQESTLAPGTGLGLNMVKSLVDLQRGSIDIESQVGKGTTVVVKLPLLKAQRSSNPPPLLRVLSYGETTNPLQNKKLNRENFELQGFNAPSSKTSKESVERYLLEWFELTKNPPNQAAKIVIVNEEELDECLFKVGQYPVTPQLIIICHQSSQEQLFQRLSRSTIAGELLTLPFGPQKLAKVLSICLSALDKLPVSRIPNIIGETFSASPVSNEVPEPLQASHTPDGTKVSQEVIPLIFKETQPSLALLENSIGESAAAFSIPMQEPQSCHEPMLTPPPDNVPSGFLSHGYSPIPLQMAEKIVPLQPPTLHGPSILCVDDNLINIRLLKTYMEKLHYTDVVCAENGAIAFDEVRRRPEGFDLIFMDLSMPVCDGFECISLIRILETMQVKAAPKDGILLKPSTIVALTGLAAQRDRDAAMAAGADHFVMKPLKFSALKGLLTEWEIAIPTR